jgi:quercetin dioxygenase-like cupin family protein
MIPATRLMIAQLSSLAREPQNGETGRSLSQVLELPNLRLRLVEYEAGYRADHWCDRGHIFHLLQGELMLELQDGRSFTLVAGDCFVVSDYGDAAHRVRTSEGGKAFIVD